MAGKAPTPMAIRTNWSTATWGTSAPMSAAITGISLIPPGTAQRNPVQASSWGMAPRKKKPTARFSTTYPPMRIRRGRSILGSRPRSSLLTLHPINAPAVIWATVRVTPGM